jgi:hypothetical protein
MSSPETPQKMRKLFLVAGLAAAALIPSLASAQQSCEAQRGNQVAGTIVGAGAGALLGSSIAGRGDHTTGAVIGGVGGAVVGNQLSAPNADCAHAYGYYDRNSQWHANAVARADARGYFDRNGAWVAGAPNGYYDASGNWMAARTDPSASGYTDANGRWVPASANGYYNDRGEWVTTASGYYDGAGRWVRGQAAGAYDPYGDWTPGASSGHLDASGAWIADAQPGYYDAEHHWRSGAAWGYYDAEGRWIATAPGAYGSQVVVDQNGQAQAGLRRDVDGRAARLEQRIRISADNGSLSRADADRDLRSLTSIRRQEADLRGGDGQLSPQSDAMLQARLDRLSDRLRQSIGDGRGS